MNLSNMVSDAVLAFTGIWVFWKYFGEVSWYNRLLWGFFLLPVSMTALIGILKFAGIDSVSPVYQLLKILTGSVGVVCVVVAVWSLIQQNPIKKTSFVTTVTLGFALFTILLNPQLSIFELVVLSLSMVVVLLIAFMGVLRRDPRASWVVVGVMIIALATRFGSSPSLPIHPIDFYHYTLSLALLCFGKAVQNVGQQA